MIWYGAAGCVSNICYSVQNWEIYHLKMGMYKHIWIFSLDIWGYTTKMISGFVQEESPFQWGTAFGGQTHVGNSKTWLNGPSTKKTFSGVKLCSSVALWFVFAWIHWVHTVPVVDVHDDLFRTHTTNPTRWLVYLWWFEIVSSIAPGGDDLNISE
jgi:hypothetical protein